MVRFTQGVVPLGGTTGQKQAQDQQTDRKTNDMDQGSGDIFGTLFISANQISYKE
jgi:hypothetical protein